MKRINSNVDRCESTKWIGRISCAILWCCRRWRLSIAATNLDLIYRKQVSDARCVGCYLISKYQFLAMLSICRFLSRSHATRIKIHCKNDLNQWNWTDFCLLFCSEWCKCCRVAIEFDWCVRVQLSSVGLQVDRLNWPLSSIMLVNWFIWTTDNI